MKVLITGASGKLGQELLKLFSNKLIPTHKEFDIINRIEVFGYIKKYKPNVIVHLAALTGINQCEQDKELAWNTNVEGTRNLIDACKMYNPKIYFVYMSTPCVFSGIEGNYNEDSIPYPKHFYGLTKLLGEVIVRNNMLFKYLIVRGNFVPKKKWMYPKAFSDRYGTYLFAHQLARAIKDVIDKKMLGIVHLVGERKISMYELAKMCPDSDDVLPMTLKEYQGPPLTVDMSLSSKRWKKYKIEE